MKAHLLFRDRDRPASAPLGAGLAEVVRDLGLAEIFDAMAGGDRDLRRIVEEVVLATVDDPAAIVYRQEALEDCLRMPAVARELYALVVAALQEEHQVWGFSERSPSSVLYRSLRVLDGFLAALQRLRELAETHAGEFRSEAFTQLFTAIRSEVDAAFFAEASAHLARLRARDRLLLSAPVGPDTRPPAWTLRTPRAVPTPRWRRLLARADRAHTIVLADRDETGHRLLGELIDRGLAPSSAALGRSVDHLLQFFRALQAELGFYIAALNLEERLRATGNPTCRPRVDRTDGPTIVAHGIYDPGLALRLGRPLAPNDADAGGKRLVVLTGANQGGKSTWLRAWGVAQLFAQAGLRVGAERLSTGLASAVFTHFRREEDPTMRHGKLEEELGRLRAIAGAIRPGALLLCNESLSSTNEREGSEIASQVVRALVEGGVTVIFVTFLHEFADGWCQQQRPDSLFLRVERLPDGRRTFRLVPGAPVPAGFAEDLSREVLDAPVVGPVVAPAASAPGGRR